MFNVIANAMFEATRTAPQSREPIRRRWDGQAAGLVPRWSRTRAGKTDAAGGS